MHATRCLCVALLLAPALRAEEKPASFWDEKEAVRTFAFSPDGRLLATGGRSVSIWEMPALVRRQHLKDTGWVRSLVFTPDGKSLVLSGARGEENSVLAVIDLEGGKRRALGSSLAWVRALSLSPDGKRLAAAGESGSVDLVDLGTGKRLRTLKGHKGDVWGVAFSPDGKMLATTGDEDKVVKLWEVATGEVRLTLKGHKWNVASVAFAPDGKTLLSGAGVLHYDFKPPDIGELFVWDLVTGKVKMKLLQGLEAKGLVIGLAFSADGKTLASASQSYGHRVVKLWDWPAGKERRALEGPPGDITGLGFSPDGRWLLVSGDVHDPYHAVGGVRLWDATTGRQQLPPALEAERDRRAKILREQERRQKEARAVRDDKERAGYWRREAERRADRQRRAEYALAITQAEETIRTRQWEEARKLLDGLKPGPGEIDLRGLEWHYLRGRLPREIKWKFSDDPSDTVATAATLDRRTVAVAEGREATLIDGETGHARATLKGFDAGVRLLAFSQDGRLLAVAEQAEESKPARLTLWNVNTARKVAELPGHHGETCGLTFSADGKFLAATGTDCMARVWDVRRHKLVHAFGKHEHYTYECAFSPDGKILVINVNQEGYIFYDLMTGKKKARLKDDNFGNAWSRRFFRSDRDLAWVGYDREKARLILYECTRWYRSELRTSDGLDGLTFSDDGQDLLAEDDNRQLYRWDIATGEARRIPPVSEAQAEFVFDGKAGKVRAGQNILSLREMARLSGDVKGEKLRWAALHAVSPDGRLILTGEGETLVIRDAATGKVRAALPFVKGDERKGRAAFSTDGRTLFTFFTDRTNYATDVIAWDTNTGKEVGRIVAPGEVVGMRLDRDGKAPIGLLIYARDFHGCRHWDVETGEYTFEVHGSGVSVSPDGMLLAAIGGGDSVRLHDAATGHLRLTLRDHPGGTVAFHPHGKALAVGSSNIRLYRVLDVLPKP